MLIPVVAYFWSGGVPTEYKVKGVSPGGAYIVTDEKWYRGTIMSVMFQYDPYYLKVASINGNSSAALQVRTKVVRSGPDGVGVQFLFLNKQERERFESFLAGAKVRDV